MAMTINPAVSGVSYRRWAFHVGLFFGGVVAGSLLVYAGAHSIYCLLAIASPALWLLVAVPVLGLAVLRDLGFRAPVPYRRGQVPEWLRRVVPPGVAATAYGGQLGVGFLTNFTYSTHTAFVALLATQARSTVVGLSVLAFAWTKTIILFTSLAPRSERNFQERFQRRLPKNGSQVLRLGNAACALATAAILIVDMS